MPRAGHAAILMVLDETGSMESIKGATISAYNEFVGSQARVAGSAEFWLLRFNTCRQRPTRGAMFPIEKGEMAASPLLDAETYVPDCTTPLWDAVGYMIETAGSAFDARAEQEKPQKVVLVVQTDGYENASRFYTAERVRQLIQQQQRDWGWQVLMLGAGVDAWAIGQQIGLAARQVAVADASAVGQEAVYDVMASKLADFRLRDDGDLYFTEEEQDQLAGTTNAARRRRHST